MFLAVNALLLCACFAAEPSYEAPAKAGEGNSYNESNLSLRIIFLGDAGEPSEEFLKTIKKWASIEPEKTVAAFLGDNAYPDGLAGPDSAKAHRDLEKLLETIRVCGVKSIFIAGNHDWGPGYSNLNALTAQVQSIKEKLPNALFMPPPGCPGPVQLEMGGVSFIIIDSQLWFMEESPSAAPCNAQTRTHAIDSLGVLLQTATWPTVVLAHHPIVSYGRHAGYYTWKEHLFPLTMAAPWMWVPLPVLGSIYVFGRTHLFPSRQDFAGKYYREYNKEISRAISHYKGKPPLVIAAGHDHNLQIITQESGGKLSLISGAGSKKKLYSVRFGPGALFTGSKEGFILLAMYEGGRGLIRVVEVDRDKPAFLLEVP